MGAFDDLIKTPNFKLNKPGYGNVADIEALNENFDILDGLLYPGSISYYVDANVSVSGDGTEINPFKSIQEAVNAIKNTFNEVYIYVKGGTYNEDVLIFSKPFKVIFIQAYDTTNKPMIKSLFMRNNGICALSDLKFFGVNDQNAACTISYTDATLNNIEIIESGDTDNHGLLLYAVNAMISNCNISGRSNGVYAVYGSGVEINMCNFTDNTYDLVAQGSTIYTDNENQTGITVNAGAVINTAVGEALTKDLYSVLIDENTFRNRALASAMSNVISTLFMEVFADTNGINKSLGDAATAIENYYNARGHIFEKTDSGTITLYTLPQTVNTGNGKVWVYADYISKGGSVELAISRDGGTTYTVVSEGVLTDISTRPAGTTMSLRIRITGAVTLKNVAWGCK